jgi:arginase family enzyme
MKINFIPNWNGHLFLQNYKDNSITKLYNELEFENKDLVKVIQNNFKETNAEIETQFNNNLNQFQLSVTGDHSNSYPLIKAFSKVNGNNFKLVIFDAHPDVEVGTDLVSHEDYLRFLIDEDLVKPENIYLFGIRTFSRTEYQYLIDKKVNFMVITDVLQNHDKVKQILESLEGTIYTTTDIDVLDPDVAPGTYYREYCGLYLEELLEYLSIIIPKSKSADFSEFYSEKDDEFETTKINALKLINHIIELVENK